MSARTGTPTAREAVADEAPRDPRLLSRRGEFGPVPSSREEPMTAHIGDPLLHTYQEAAQRLNVSVRWLQEHVQRRTIPHRRLGRQVRFSDDDLQEILDSTRQAAVRPRRAMRV